MLSCLTDWSPSPSASGRDPELRGADPGGSQVHRCSHQRFGQIGLGCPERAGGSGQSGPDPRQRCGRWTVVPGTHLCCECVVEGCFTQFRNRQRNDFNILSPFSCSRHVWWQQQPATCVRQPTPQCKATQVRRSSSLQPNRWRPPPPSCWWPVRWRLTRTLRPWGDSRYKTDALQTRYRYHFVALIISSHDMERLLAISCSDLISSANRSLGMR